VYKTNGQTDGIAVASTALAMRALQRAVKMLRTCKRLLAWAGSVFSLFGSFVPGSSCECSEVKFSDSQEGARSVTVTASEVKTF